MPRCSFLILFGIGNVLIGGCSPCSAPKTPVPVSSPTSVPESVSTIEVKFTHGGNVLSGTLYRPAGRGPHPAVALVLGSGKQDRAYGGIGTALGNHFAQNGFACLAWDKPGCGQSTGDFNEQTLEDRADEALAAVRFLRSQDDIRTNCVGLWGHSQGGTVVPLAAALSSDVTFIIGVAGWQGPAWQQDMVRVAEELRAAGFSETDVESGTSFARRRMDLIRGSGPFEELDAAQESVKNERWFRAVHRCDRKLFYSARRMVEYDSGPSWEKVRCPVLAIFGDNDTSTGPADPLVEIIRRGLAKADNDDVTIKIFPDANHSLCHVQTDGGKEARLPQEKDGPEFISGYLDTMIGWLTKKLRSAAGR